MSLPDKWLTVDPGEDCGWAVWSGRSFIEHGTDKMWEFGDAVWNEAFRQTGENDGRMSSAYLPPELDPNPHLAAALEGISMVVLENWTLYPVGVGGMRPGALDWDECRTARLIGSIYQACRLMGWKYEQQGAKIKGRALAAGAENFFSHPLHENRHANDATMHGVFRIALDEGAPWADLNQSSWDA